MAIEEPTEHCEAWIGESYVGDAVLIRSYEHQNLRVPIAGSPGDGIKPIVTERQAFIRFMHIDAATGARPQQLAYGMSVTARRAARDTRDCSGVELDLYFENTRLNGVLVESPFSYIPGQRVEDIDFPAYLPRT